MHNTATHHKVQGAVAFINHMTATGCECSQNEVFRFFGVTVDEGSAMLHDQSLSKPVGAGEEKNHIDETSGNSQKPSSAPKRSREKQNGNEGPKNQDKNQAKKDGQPPSKKRKDSHSKDDSTKNDETIQDLSKIQLEGEERDAVPVYETCDMVRRKIDQHLKRPGLTQTAFCRDMEAAFFSSTTARHVTQTQLSSFRGKKGYDAGNTSNVFYAAYCFFEKLRIKEGKPKSKDRQKMEELWAREGGFDTQRPAHAKYLTLGPGEGVKKDKYGQVTIITARGSRQVGVM